MIRILAAALTLGTLLPAQTLTPRQTAIVHAIDEEAPAAVSLLERLVNINSGTFNLKGVAEIAKVLTSEFQALGFTVRTMPMPSVKRGPHLIAERKRGAGGKKILLIGHMDTVFEPTSPFQKFNRNGDTATGPGVSDMKGGIVVMLSALKALQKADALDGVNLTVFLTGDEEAAGNPVSTARKEFIEAGKNHDVALCFETGARSEGKDFASTARRGFTSWNLRVTANTGHSGGIFSERMGDGAIYEISRILNQFHDTLREPNLTYNVGMVLGGTNPKRTPDGQGTVTGKSNIVPAEAQAIGEIRALYPQQLAGLKDKMHSIVARNLPGAKAEITFEDEYPPMAPTPGNTAILTRLNDVNRALGVPEMGALDPMLRGAGDASFIAPFVDTLSGLGANGSGAHAPGESIDLSRQPLQTKRAALLILQLAAEKRK